MLQSPPSRRRGLKYYITGAEMPQEAVASFSEAWIEILSVPAEESKGWVASFSEAWIEILWLSGKMKNRGSPPSRRRGLKY